MDSETVTPVDKDIDEGAALFTFYCREGRVFYRPSSHWRSKMTLLESLGSKYSSSNCFTDFSP